MASSHAIDPELDFALAPNGLEAGTGRYLHAGLSLDDLFQLARGARRASRDEPRRAPREGVDPLRLASTGWGVIFARDADPAVREALAPLLELRRQQAGERYRLLAGEDGYETGESKVDFLARHSTRPGPVDPRRMPWYLLLAGGPEEIPYEFQHQLDTQLAVGRLAFDTPEEYARYAAQVVESETRPPAEPSRRLALFGVEHPGDEGTRCLNKYLVPRVASCLAEDCPGWTVTTVSGAEATRDRLGRMLSGTGVPALLFAAGHGVGFGCGHSRQREHQGALVCGDWPGPRAGDGIVGREHYFAGEDLGDARVPGLVAFQYSCHSAGTPRLDVYTRDAAPRELAPRPFVSRLPQRLLTAGALAVVGHVERTWGTSYLWWKVAPQPVAFQDTLKRLLAGHPIGSALEPFGQESGELAADLLAEQNRLGGPRKEALGRLWLAAQDSRSFVLLGDPAVRLPHA